MTSLEIIKEIEESYKTGQWPIEHKDGVFLLKAFKVAQDIAIEYIRIHNGYGCKTDFPLSLGDKQFDEELEERMKSV